MKQNNVWTVLREWILCILGCIISHYKTKNSDDRDERNRFLYNWDEQYVDSNFPSRRWESEILIVH